MNRPRNPPLPPQFRTRRILVSYDADRKAARLAGSGSARAFSDLVHALAVGAEEALAKPVGRPAPDDADAE